MWEAILDGKGEDVGEPGGFCGRRVSHDLCSPGLEDVARREPGDHPKEPQLEAVEPGLYRETASQEVDCCPGGSLVEPLEPLETDLVMVGKG